MQFYYSILHVPAHKGITGIDLREKFIARFKRSPRDNWHWYSENAANTWDSAYAILEKHATPAALAIRFVGTF